MTLKEFKDAMKRLKRFKDADEKFSALNLQGDDYLLMDGERSLRLHLIEVSG